MSNKEQFDETGKWGAPEDTADPTGRYAVIEEEQVVTNEIDQEDGDDSGH